MELKQKILDYSRQTVMAAQLPGSRVLSPWLDEKFDQFIADGSFMPEHSLELLSAGLVHQLACYRVETGKRVVVLGMSGGVDSALTAALFKKAGWDVIGYMLPIEQDPSETARGVEACGAIGIQHDLIDLTALYRDTCDILHQSSDVGEDEYALKIRRGNIRARLRMVTLYHLASKHNGLVASTDNLSELVAGFWTLHGDVGDVSPIQSLLKSWEVPYLAQLNGVPESTWRATPTDGLGIAAGDEAQLGATYLEFDIMTLALGALIKNNPPAMHALYATSWPLREALGMGLGDSARDGKAEKVLENVLQRIKGSWFKRQNPVNLGHHFNPRYEMVAALDRTFATPACCRK